MTLDKLPEHAKVWIYQSNRVLTPEEVQSCEIELFQFVQGWQAHGADLVAGFEVRDSRWLILAVDESGQNATGCSIDSSVAVIKRLESKLGVDFFDRQLIVWENEEGRNEDRMHDFWAKRKAGVVNDDTFVFNTLAKTLGELRQSWKSRFSESWHAEMW